MSNQQTDIQARLRTFYQTDEHLRTEQQVSRLCFEKRHASKNSHASRYLKEGFTRRHYMMQTSRLFLREETNPGRDDVLSPYTVTEANIHLNAYYLNLRGALDNLAWCLKYEHGLLENVSEGSHKNVMQCDLFGDRFLKELGEKQPRLKGFLMGKREWAQELRDVRDPAAHRIPLYVAPGILKSQEQVDEYRKIERETVAPEDDRGGKSFIEIMNRASNVADYVPLMINSTHEGLKPEYIAARVGTDHDHFLSVAIVTLQSL